MAIRAKRGPVPKEALDYFKQKGLEPAFSYRDVWKEEHNFAFTVAKVLEADLLADVQASLTRSLEEGVPFREWSKQIEDTLDSSGWSEYGTEAQKAHRLRTIYETNMRVSRTVGQWQRIQRTKRALPFLVYELGPSENHREEHEEWSGTVLPVDDPWWDTHTPPNGYGCKCHVRQITRRAAERLGGVSERPPEEFEVVDDPSTGEPVTVPKGIQVGWDFNPGAVEQRRRSLDEVEETAGEV